MKKHMEHSLVSYWPSLLLFFLGLLFFIYPFLAALILGGLSFFFAFTYGLWVYRYYSLLGEHRGGETYDDFEQFIFDRGGPEFKNISFFILRRYFKF